MKIWSISLILLLNSFVSFSQNELTYSERKGQEFYADTTRNVDIYLYGTTTDRSQAEEDNLLPGVIITMRDLYGETIQILSDDSAFYNLELSFDNKYQIYYQYKDMYTKYIEVDTRDVINIEQERGYLLPTDMSLQRAYNYEIEALYHKKPIGKLYFDRRLQMMAWDMEYTEKMKKDVKKLNSKMSKR